MKAASLLVIYFACLIWQTEQQKCHSRELAFCVLPSMMSARTSLIPKDEKSLTNACRIWNNKYKCIMRYQEQCFTDIHRMIMHVVLRQPRELDDELCEKNTQMRNDFVKALPCLTEVYKLTRRTCFENIENVLYQLTGENLAEGVTAGCCYFEHFYNCYNNHLQKICGKEHIPVIEKASGIMHLDTLHSLCGLHDPQSERCYDALSRNITNPSETSSYLTRMAMLFFRE